MEEALAGKSVLIVGGTTGLGFSAAKAVLREGGNVGVIGRNSESAEAANSALESIVEGRSFASVGDAVDPETVEKAIATCLDRIGGFDALYHVAGGSGRSFGDGPLDELTEEGLDKTLDLNLKSLILSNRAAARSFLERGVPGAVLNMGSTLGFSPSPKYFATHAYAAAKAGIIGFTKSVAAYYASNGIRFNVIAPALVETPMSLRATTDDSILNFLKTKQPLHGGSAGRPEDLDGLAVCLLSDQSRYVTGQVIAVDGGWSVSEGQY